MHAWQGQMIAITFVAQTLQAAQAATHGSIMLKSIIVRATVRTLSREFASGLAGDK